VTNDHGGVLDDVLVGRLKTPSDRQYCLLVVNASNRAKIVAWIQHHWPSAGDVEFSDRTEDTAMIAVQGPRAMDIVASLVKADVRQLGYYTGVVTETFGRVCNRQPHGLHRRRRGGVDRPSGRRGRCVEEHLSSRPRGGCDRRRLGARDTLRLEAGMPLYGHELSEQINPYQAGLGFAVNLLEREFIGRDALAGFQADPQQPRRVGLALAGRRVAREHSPVLSAGGVVGQVTSGTFSPSFDKPIAMAYVRPEAAAVGTELQVDIRGRSESARGREIALLHSILWIRNFAVDAKELLYAETHEWVHVAEEGGVKTATIGISAFAVEQLTDLVYLELPQVGRQLSVGEEFGEVESVKAVSPLYCPIAGKVVQVNTALPDSLRC